MLEFLRGKAGERKLRLFACACCRRIWDFITDAQSRAVVEITERSADSPVDVNEVLSLDYDRLTDDCGPTEEPYRHAFMVAGNVGFSLMGPIHNCLIAGNAWLDADDTAKGAGYVKWESVELSDKEVMRLKDTEAFLPAFRAYKAAEEVARDECQAAEQVVQCGLLRCIFGPLPFRPITFDRSWLDWKDSTIPKLAQAIYNDRAFDRLSILADALEESGCDNPEILNHCRQPGEHVRGCWALDLVLGRQ
jgi:hypothetical protein